MIQQDDEIRLKIVGTRVDKNDIVSEVPGPRRAENWLLFTYSC